MLRVEKEQPRAREACRANSKTFFSPEGKVTSTFLDLGLDAPTPRPGNFRPSSRVLPFIAREIFARVSGPYFLPLCFAPIFALVSGVCFRPFVGEVASAARFRQPSVPQNKSRRSCSNSRSSRSSSTNSHSHSSGFFRRDLWKGRGSLEERCSCCRFLKLKVLPM